MVNDLTASELVPKEVICQIDVDVSTAIIIYDLDFTIAKYKPKSFFDSPTSVGISMSSNLWPRSISRTCTI